MTYGDIMKYRSQILQEYVETYRFIDECLPEIEQSVSSIIKSVSNSGKILICGNGGSCADADHIVGELVKGFLKKRHLKNKLKEKLINFGEKGKILADITQEGIPAINLGCHTALSTAIINDIGGEFIFSQQIAALADKGDVVWCISTSGNSKNIINAAIMAHAKEAYVIGMTGSKGGILKGLSDCCIRVPSDSTPYIQDMHTSVYHVICALVEEYYWKN